MNGKGKEKEVQKLYNGITDISEELIHEAQKNSLGTKSLAKKHWGVHETQKNSPGTKSLAKKRSGVLAACICATAAWAFLWTHAPETGGKGTSDGVTIPPLEISVPEEGQTATASMIGFFIYQGRRYAQYDWLSDETADKAIGEYLGTATGSIDEWTPQNRHVELSGSIGGDFYSVNGFDPAFMLCMPRDNGVVEIFICNTGITLKTGSDLYEDRLHISGNYRAVQYETSESWYGEKNDMHRLDGTQSDGISDFIKALNAAEFILEDDIPRESIEIGKEVYFMYFEMENGMTIRLRLYEDGYVFFQGLMGAGVQIPKDQFQKTIHLLDQMQGRG